jgi:NAD(P)-dependent dehydrogenase (short-subunit alcohol dehydrogenase family)
MQVPEELQFMVNARMPQKTTDARVDGKVCVLTGATAGVGYVAARRLAQGGANLVLVCRNPEKAVRVQHELVNDYGVEVDIVLADFLHLDEVRSAAAKVLAKTPRIDLLVNNAGIHATQRRLTPQGLESVFCVNHLASFLFTRLLLDRLRDSAPARILYINSEGHRFNGLDLDDLDWSKRRYKGLQGYGAAKTAQLLTIWDMNDVLQGSGVTINAMHPGAVRSNIGMDNGFLYRFYQRYILWWFLKAPVIAADAIYYLLAAPEMADESGKFYNLTTQEKPAAHALDRVMGKQVWKISEQLTGLSDLI